MGSNPIRSTPSKPPPGIIWWGFRALHGPLARGPTEALRRTLAQEWPRFVERREAEVAASTVDEHRWVYRTWIEPVLGHRKLGPKVNSRSQLPTVEAATVEDPGVVHMLRLQWSALDIVRYRRWRSHA